MSAVDIAVQAFQKLEPEDFIVLSTIELAMDRYQYVPEKTIPKLARLSQTEVSYRLTRLEDLSLIRRWSGPYIGYILNTAGYDCLAINTFIKADVFVAFGKPLGVGKEADVYDALTQEGKRVAVKFHRLGRISFRQTRRVRGYAAEHPRVSWLHQSKLAAEKEFEALKLVYPYEISVPEPIHQNRHALVMDMIEGIELFRCIDIPNPNKILEEILFNLRKSYLLAKVIHADLSEFNVILKPDLHILIIDWPQFVKTDHPNAEYLLRRDIENITKFFQRKFKVNSRITDALAYITDNYLKT